VSTGSTGLKIDAHSHIFPTDMLAKPGKYGPEIAVEADGSRVFRVGPHRLRLRPDDFRPGLVRSDPHLRIADMDRKGIDIVGVTVSAGFYLYYAEPVVGVEFSRLHNDALAAFCRPYPDRLFFIPTLPIQDIPASLRELDRAVNELGGRGANLGTEDLAGRELDDPALWPVYARLQELDLPLFLHPGPAGDPAARTGQTPPYNLLGVIGFIGQETAAVARLIYGGVLDAFPRLKVVVSHGGGAVPYQWGRIERGATAQPDVRARRPAHEYLENFYFDNLVHDRRARELLIAFAGVDHVLVGDNYEGWDHADGFAYVDELHLSDADKRKLRAGNALRLFKLKQRVA
jgi:aminocarboxymuconate-semialdehyde decarboxylase